MVPCFSRAWACRPRAPSCMQAFVQNQSLPLSTTTLNFAPAHRPGTPACSRWLSTPGEPAHPGKSNSHHTLHTPGGPARRPILHHAKGPQAAGSRRERRRPPRTVLDRWPGLSTDSCWGASVPCYIPNPPSAPVLLGACTPASLGSAGIRSPTCLSCSAFCFRLIQPLATTPRKRAPQCAKRQAPARLAPAAHVHAAFPPSARMQPTFSLAVAGAQEHGRARRLRAHPSRLLHLTKRQPDLRCREKHSCSEPTPLRALSPVWVSAAMTTPHPQLPQRNAHTRSRTSTLACARRARRAHAHVGPTPVTRPLPLHVHVHAE
jgi:hypothetical protein